jgi:hypothetical protein
MGQLIDTTNLRIVRAVCAAGGVELHETKDCPRDRSCPVYASLWRLPLSFEQARQEIDRIRERDHGTYVAMRKEASDALEADMREWHGEDHGFDIGSSDVSIKVIEMYRFGEMEV